MKQPSLRNGLAAWDSTWLRSYTHLSLVNELSNLLAARTSHLHQAAHTSSLNNEIKFFLIKHLITVSFYSNTKEHNSGTIQAMDCSGSLGFGYMLNNINLCSHVNFWETP